MLQALRGLQSFAPGHPLSPDGDSPCPPGDPLLSGGDSLLPGFEVQLVDVDRDPELAKRYDEWVPVLCLGEEEICHYRLDEQALRAALHRQ
ncbi:MAG TPA: glutaredoxin family protein [Gammaproteobacteria bacterium]|nr:glutaredoxin family protein [Gammaproteobacteria bacterium]